jgi:hypothetical protein
MPAAVLTGVLTCRIARVQLRPRGRHRVPRGGQCAPLGALPVPRVPHRLCGRGQRLHPHEEVGCLPLLLGPCTAVSLDVLTGFGIVAQEWAASIQCCVAVLGEVTAP